MMLRARRQNLAPKPPKCGAPDATARRLDVIETVLAHLVAERAWATRPKPLPPLSASELDTLDEVAGLVEPGVRLQVGDLTDDPKRAGRYGRVLAKAARRGTVGRYRVEKLPKHAGRAVWVLYVN